MNFVEVLKECESAQGAGTKKIIQAALSKLDADGRKLMRYAMDPYMVFNVKKFDRPTGYSDTNPENIDFLFKMLDQLASREITGDAARALVRATMCFFTEETASYLERILDKDPRAGFSSDTFNKVWPNEKIPTFEVMLADKCEDEEDFDLNIQFPCRADVKYDGQRTICIVREGRPVEYRARSGKEMDHLAGLFDAELLILRNLLGYDFVMDGESFASDFTETINAKKTGNDKAKANLKLHCFFMMPLTDWIAQSTTITMEENRQALERLLLEVPAYLDLSTDELGEDVKAKQKIILTTSKIVNNYQEMTEHCNHVIDVLKQEGLILKQLNAVYTWDRSMAWCKVKRFYPADAKILGFYYGRPKSRLENTIGGAIIAGYTEDKELFITAVGSGFRDNASDDSPIPLRSEILADLRKYVGATAVVSYQEVSRTKSKAVASLRFPTINDIRDDKIIELPDDLDFEFIFKGRKMIQF